VYICSVKFFPSVHELIYCRCRSSHCLGLSSPIPLLHYQSQLWTSSLHQSLTRGITVSFWKVTNFGKRSHLIFVYTIEYDYFMESTTSFQKICVDHDPKPFSIDTYVPDIISVWTFSLISVTFIIQITFNLCSIVRSANMCEELELSLHHFLYDVTSLLSSSSLDIFCCHFVHGLFLFHLIWKRCVNRCQSRGLGVATPRFWDVGVVDGW